MPRIMTLCIIVLACGPSGMVAQTTTPADAIATTQPADIEPMSARIAKVTGNVSYAVVDANGTVGPWQPAKVGDQLPAGTRIQTHLRSQVTLTFGDDTVALIERATLASIDTFHRGGGEKKIQLGLGHGAIRAGVAESTLRSDMTIETPTATLSKRGTWDFRIEYQPGFGRFRMSLAAQGLVEALNKLTNQSRHVLPGQYVTQAMLNWIETAKFDRRIPVTDVFGLTASERKFNLFNHTGLGGIDPGSGAAIGQQLRSRFSNSNINTGQDMSYSLLPQESQIRNRPEGNFGTGAGSLINLKRR